jgi:hypothetical protein
MSNIFEELADRYKNLKAPDPNELIPYVHKGLEILKAGSEKWQERTELPAIADEDILIMLTTLAFVEIRVCLKVKLAGIKDEYKVTFRFTGTRAGISQALEPFFQELWMEHQGEIENLKNSTGRYPGSILSFEILQWRLTPEGIKTISQIKKSKASLIEFTNKISLQTPQGSGFLPFFNYQLPDGCGALESIEKNTESGSDSKTSEVQSSLGKLIQSGFDAIIKKLLHIEKKIDAGQENTDKSIDTLNQSLKAENSFTHLGTTLNQAALLFYLKDGCVRTDEVNSAAKRLSDKWRRRLERNPELKPVFEKKKGKTGISYYSIRQLAVWIYKNEPAQPCSLDNFILSLAAKAEQIKNF